VEVALDTYRLAGLDDRERGFSRPVEFDRAGEGYRAILRYESTNVTTDPHPNQEAALLVLIETLQAHGYRQLRTQVSFRNGSYLGSQALWVDYPDPAEPVHPSPGFIAKLFSWFRSQTRYNKA
jgi:hypothetical protein